MVSRRRHDVDHSRAPARAPVADQLGLQLTDHRRLEITALDHERAAPELGEQAPAAGAPNVPPVDRHAGRRVSATASRAVAGESFVCGPDGRVMARGVKSADDIVYCDVDYSELAHSNARQLFMKHRRPELYTDWISKT